MPLFISFSSLFLWFLHEKNRMKSWRTIHIITFSLVVANSFSQTQGLIVPQGVDSAYILKYQLKNDLRLFYGAQGTNMAIGTKHEGATTINKNLYTNSNDFVGMGLTYKWIDGDVSFSIPGTTYLNEERSNLTQFKLSGSFSTRKVSLRGYISDSKGVVLSGAENEFQSTPSLHEQRIGVQITYLFNSSKYSYRAATYQSEVQQQTAGSFLLRVEPFYRNLGDNNRSMIPATFDTEARFGDQVGIEYVKAPGILVMPGYGINIIIPNTRYFISPMVFGGLGVAKNYYRSANGKNSYPNVEYAAYFNLNAGYNSSAYYARIQFTFSGGYAALNPSYLTTVNLAVSGTFGIRFRDLEKFL